MTSITCIFATMDTCFNGIFAIVEFVMDTCCMCIFAIVAFIMDLYETYIFSTVKSNGLINDMLTPLTTPYSISSLKTPPIVIT